MKKSILLFYLFIALWTLNSCGSDVSTERNITENKSKLASKPLAKEVKEISNKTAPTNKPSGKHAIQNVEKQADKKQLKPKPKVTPKPKPKSKPRSNIKRVKKKVVKPKLRSKTSKLVFYKTVHQYGHIKQGEVVEVDFKFVNTGNGDLLISNADATCGCTTPNFPFIPIEAGKSGTIGVTYNSKGKLGPQKQIITVYSNDSKKVHKLYLEGVVTAELEKPKSEQ